MLTHPTLDRLLALGLTGMPKAFDDQRRQPDVAALPFEDRLALMVDREIVERQNKSLATRLKFAGLRHAAIVEDIDLATPAASTGRCSPASSAATGSSVSSTC